MNCLQRAAPPRFVLHTLKRRCYRQRHGYAASLVEHEQDEKELRAKYKPLEKLPVKTPLVKNFFRAKIDTDFFAFPEFLHGDRLKLLSENSEVVLKLMNEEVNSEKIDLDGRIPDELLQKLGQLKLFGLCARRSDGGAEFTHTERARIYEVISRDTSIGALLFNQETLGHKLIAKYGDQNIKDKFLKSLTTGKIFSALCLGEAESGSDPLFFDTVAVRNGTEWLLSGSKVWVMNADKADIFIVVAKVQMTDGKAKRNLYYKTEGEDPLVPEDVGIFLVEKNTFNMTIGPKLDTIGIRGLSMCEVQFDETPVPETNILTDFSRGYEVVKEIISDDRYINGCLALGILQSVQKDLHEHVIKRKLHGDNLYKFELAQQKLSGLNVAIYAIESMIYYTTGIMDMYYGQDCEVENAIVKVFSSELAWTALNDALTLLGSKALLADTKYDRHVRNMRMLSSFDHCNDLYRCFITLNCLRYISSDINNYIVERRNPIWYPYLGIKQFFSRSYRRRQSDDPELYLKFKEYLHPSFIYLADLFERCVIRFDHGVSETLVRSGPNLVHSQMYIARMADCATILYAMMAVLSRASRSYCIGSKYSTEEMIMAESFVRDASSTFERSLTGLIGGEYFATDNNLKKLAHKAVENSGYFVTEPLKLTY